MEYRSSQESSAGGIPISDRVFVVEYRRGGEGEERSPSICCLIPTKKMCSRSGVGSGPKSAAYGMSVLRARGQHHHAVDVDHRKDITLFLKTKGSFIINVSPSGQPCTPVQTAVRAS